MLVIVVHLVCGLFREMPISERQWGAADWSGRSDQRERRELQTEAICGGWYFIV